MLHLSLNQKDMTQQMTKRARTSALMKWIQRKSLSLILFGLYYGLKLCKRQHAAWLGGKLLKRIGPFTKLHRRVTTHVSQAFPSYTSESVKELASHSWEHLGMTLFEYPHLYTFAQNSQHLLSTQQIQIIGMEHIERLQQAALPSIVFSAHLGNWELSAVFAKHFNIEAHALYVPPTLPMANHILTKQRGLSMGPTIPTTQPCMRKIYALLESRKTLVHLIDQYDPNGIPTLFFNQMTRVNPLVAKLARRFDPVLVCGSRVIRKSKGVYVIEVTPPLALPRDSENQIDVERSMHFLTEIVEEWVREHPAQWLWLHRRWREPVPVV